MYGGLLLLLAILAVAGWAIMIRVKPPAGSPPPEPPAAAMEALEARLQGHVRALAGEIGVRNLYRPEGLVAASSYLARQLQDLGAEVEYETYEWENRPYRNVVTAYRGDGAEDEVVVVGAHYDTAPNTPGADDNGSGCAALIEVARVLARTEHTRTIRFVLFANEEPPHYTTEGMGSRVHARRSRERGDDVVAMLSLETVGYYTDAPGSQLYPPPFGWFYPDRGNFLGVVGNLASRGLVIETLRNLQATTTLPVEGVATFDWIQGVSWSDHWSFWLEGYPAVMVSDTAPFRYPDYHTTTDLPEMLDYPRFARATAGIAGAVLGLAGGEPTSVLDALAGASPRRRPVP